MAAESNAVALHHTDSYKCQQQPSIGSEAASLILQVVSHLSTQMLWCMDWQPVVGTTQIAPARHVGSVPYPVAVTSHREDTIASHLTFAWGLVGAKSLTYIMTCTNASLPEAITLYDQCSL